MSGFDESFDIAARARKLKHDLAFTAPELALRRLRIALEDAYEAGGGRVEDAYKPSVKKTERQVAKKRKAKRKKKQSFCEGARKSCAKRGKGKTPFCKSIRKSCGKKRGGKKRRSCPKGKVTRGPRKGRCRK